MKFARVIHGIATAALLALAWRSESQETPASGLYQIVSGTYAICCGIPGTSSRSLPEDGQRYIQLDADNTNRIRMTILGSDGQTIFRQETCTVGDIDFVFDFGHTTSSNIVFHEGPSLPPNFHYYDYTVGFVQDQVKINGAVGVLDAVCPNSPHRFSYVDVFAILIPPTTVRPAKAEVCWNANSNRTYQVQYRSSLTSNGWMNLGLPVAGNGQTNCISDSILPEESKRFYRVVTVP